MNRDDRLLLATGAVATVLGVAAGIAEITAGTVSWAGNKNDPTTLGWVTVGLGFVVGAASAVAARSPRAAAHLAATVVLLACALVGLTTAGLAWLPAALVALAAGALIIRRPREHAAWRIATRQRSAPALVGVLAVVYLTFGIVARNLVGLLGIVGAVLAVTAIAVHRRSRLAATIGLIVAATPFAVATAWTVVIPLTAVLMLAIGVPYVLDRAGGISPHGRTT